MSSRGNNDGYFNGIPDPGDRYDPNKKPEFVAPGEEIHTAFINDRYSKSSGTSIAAPFVTGVLALILQAKPAYRPSGSDGGTELAIQNVKDALMNTAIPCPEQDTPHDEYYGYGIIDPVRAMAEL